MLNKSRIPKFQYENYLKASQKSQYIYDILIEHLQRKKLDINSPYLCMNELIEIINEIEIGTLKIKQMHEIYLYSTYQKYESKNQAKKKLQALMNQQKKKVDISAVARWLNENIQKKNLIPNMKPINNHTSSMSDQSKIRATSMRKVSTKNKVQWKLPPIKGTSSEKLTEELKFLVQIFEQMEKQRQNSGLIPVNLESDDQELDLSATHIPYDPELYLLNNNLAKLRYKAEQRLSRIIELARDEPRIRKKLEEAIQKFQKTRIQANEKVGRIGAMKAQKRLIERQKKQQDKFKKLKLGEEQDLLKAAHLYSLVVGVQQKKINHNLIF